MNKTYIKEQVLKNLTSPHLPEIIDALLNEQSPSHTGTAPLAAGKEVDYKEYGKQILKSISDTFLKPENLSKASFNDQAVIQAVGETILNFPLPEPSSPLPVNRDSKEDMEYVNTQVIELLIELRNNIRYSIPVPSVSMDARITSLITQLQSLYNKH